MSEVVEAGCPLEDVEREAEDRPQNDHIEQVDNQEFHAVFAWGGLDMYISTEYLLRLLEAKRGRMSQIQVKEITNSSPHGAVWRVLSPGGDIREEFERLLVELWPRRAIRASWRSPQDQRQQGHPDRNTVVCLSEVPGRRQEVDVFGKLIRPRQRMKDDETRLCPVQLVPIYNVGLPGVWARSAVASVRPCP